MAGQDMMLSKCRQGGQSQRPTGRTYQIKPLWFGAWWDLCWQVYPWLESTTYLWPLGFWHQLKSLPLDFGTEGMGNRGLGGGVFPSPEPVLTLCPLPTSNPPANGMRLDNKLKDLSLGFCCWCGMLNVSQRSQGESLPTGAGPWTVVLLCWPHG